MKKTIGGTLKDIFKVLHDNKRVTTAAQYAKSLGTYAHLLNEMYDEKRPVTVKVLTALHNIYDVNSNYILTAGEKGEMFNNYTAETKSETTIANLNRENNFLKTELKDKEKIIKLLEHQLGHEEATTAAIPLKRKNVG